MGPKKAAKKPAAKSAAAGDDAKVGAAGGKSGAARGGKAGKGKKEKGDKEAEGAAPAVERVPPTPEQAFALIWRCLKGLQERHTTGELRCQRHAEIMQETRRKAFAEQVRLEQKKRAAEMQLQKDKKAAEALKRKQQEEMFEAAFDGEVETMKALVEKGVSVHITDPHENTPLGEAAVAGQVAAVEWLLDKGADPNIIGAHGRTPLFRAAFNSFTAACKMLLERGADPRIAAQAELPVDIASGECKALLQGWDIGKSEAIISRLKAEREAREKKAREEAERVAKDLEGSIDAIEAKHKTAAKVYCKSKCSLEHRIEEYDKLTRLVADARKELVDAALSALHDAERAKEEAKATLDETQEELYAARLKLRIHQKKELGAEEPGTEISLKALWEAVITDVGGKMKAESKWPFVLDYSGQGTMFLKYRDTNFLNAVNSRDLEPEALRKALLGALRYGKPMVLDLMDVDIHERVEEAFQAIQDGLWGKVLNRSVTKEEVYKTLIQESDGKEYLPQNFPPGNAEKFAFVLLCANRLPPKELMDRMFVYRIPFDE
eukprot:Hpha_TRINITY_DN12201_c0_g2::TRINITY_DN12201_c0_g2_i1::g.17048::m.17048